MMKRLPKTEQLSDTFQLDTIFEQVPIAMGLSDPSSDRILYINPAFHQLFGYTLADLPDIDTWYKIASPIANFRNKILEPWVKEVEYCQQMQKELPSLETRILCKDGSARQISLFCSRVNGVRILYFNDITDHWIAEQRLKVRSDMLEMVAKSSKLKDILTVIVQQVEQESPPSLCSVLLLDRTGKQLILGAAPSLPEFYNRAIHGIQTGPDIGSCGSAAFYNKRIIVENIDTHPNWRAYTELTAKAGLTSCWSDPIRASDGTLLGTFAIYNSVSTTPTEKDIEQIQFASNIASIAIENHNAHQELERRAYYDYLTGLMNRRSFFELSESLLRQSEKSQENCALMMMDVDHFKDVNDIYGHDLGDLVLKHLAKVSLNNLPDNAVLSRIGGEEFAILLPNINNADALQIAESLRTALSSTTLASNDNQTIQFTVSLGITFSQGQHYYTDELLREADKALYKAKQTGRNCVCVFNDSQ